jgi:integrase
MLMTGCRCGEARKARVKDLDRAARTLTVHEHKTARKTGEPLVFHLTDDVLAVIDRALLARGAGGNPAAPIFASTRGPFGRTAMTQAVARACQRAGVPHWSPHRLRHTATNLLRQAAGDTMAKATIGWEDARMLIRYGREDEGRQRTQGQAVLAQLVTEALSA